MEVGVVTVSGAGVEGFLEGPLEDPAVGAQNVLVLSRPGGGLAVGDVRVRVDKVEGEADEPAGGAGEPAGGAADEPAAVTVEEAGRGRVMVLFAVPAGWRGHNIRVTVEGAETPGWEGGRRLVNRSHQLRLLESDRADMVQSTQYRVSKGGCPAWVRPKMGEAVCYGKEVGVTQLSGGLLLEVLRIPGVAGVVHGARGVNVAVHPFADLLAAHQALLRLLTPFQCVVSAGLETRPD